MFPPNSPLQVPTSRLACFKYHLRRKVSPMRRSSRILNNALVITYVNKCVRWVRETLRALSRDVPDTRHGEDQAGTWNSSETYASWTQRIVVYGCTRKMYAVIKWLWEIERPRDLRELVIILALVALIKRVLKGHVTRLCRWLYLQVKALHNI